MVESGNPQVFTALRHHQGEAELVAVSFSDAPKETTLALRSSDVRLQRKRVMLREPIAGKTAEAEAATDAPGGRSNTRRLTLEPFQVMVGEL